MSHLVDTATRRQVFLQRYGDGQAADARKVINRLRRDVNARLSQEPTDFNRQRLTDVLNDLDSLAYLAFKDMTRQIVFGAGELVKSEAQTSVKMFNQVSSAEFTLPSEEQLIAAVMAESMSVNKTAGVTINEALEQFSKKKALQISQLVSDGVTLGDTTPQITRKVSELTNNLIRRQAEALTRTIVNNVASVARGQVYAANSDIIDGYKWIATLDSRTTLICGSRDGETYQSPYGPMPPAHWNCRSTTIPEIKPEYDIARKLKGSRPSASGAVSGRTTYGGWLKRQPVEFVDEALGIDRSRLFRSGKLTLDKFIDPTGRRYTLAQLESMNPFVFS